MHRAFPTKIKGGLILTLSENPLCFPRAEIEIKWGTLMVHLKVEAV